MKKHNKARSLNISVVPCNKTISNNQQGKSTIYITTNYRTNQPNKFQPRLDSETRRLGKSYLDDLYEKYSTNLKKYLKHYNYGLRLIGNEILSQYPFNYYQKNNCSQLGQIVSKMEEMKLSFISPNNYTELKGKSTFTPIPYKSKQLVQSTKEKSELYLAERTAVMMRTYEYTYGIKSDVALMELYKKESEEKKMTILYLKKVVNKIEDWWREMKHRQFQSSERRMFNNNQKSDINANNARKQIYTNYQIIINRKNKEKGFDLLKKTFLKHIHQLKQILLNKLKSCFNNKALGFKLIKRNIAAWFNKSIIIHEINQLSIIDKPIDYNKKIGKGMISQKFSYITKSQMKRIIKLQNLIRVNIKFIQVKESTRLLLLIQKSLISKCEVKKLYKNRYVYRLRWLNRFMFKKIKIENYYSVNDLFINPIYNHDTNYDINNIIDNNYGNDTNGKVNMNSIMKSSGYSSDYTNLIKRYIILKWKTTSFKMKKERDISLYYLALQSLIFSIENASLNNLFWSFNQIISRKKSIDTWTKFLSLMNIITGKSIILSLRKIIKHKYISIVVTRILIKRSKNNIFNKWRIEIQNVKWFLQVIKSFSISLSKELFFTSLSKTNKNIITNFIEYRSNTYNEDNTFKYYCYVNRADNQSDFMYMRISLGSRIVISFLIEGNDMSNAFKQIKTKRKKKPATVALPWENIQLNPRISSKLNQFKATIQKIDLILVKQFSNDFFHRMVLNHLVTALNVNDQELMSLLKSSSENAYQQVFNRFFKLNLTDKVKKHSDVDLIKYVQKFIAESTK